MITRRQWMRWVGGSAMVLAGHSYAAAGHAKPRPNVLFIAVDDLRPELGCYGHPQIKSPNIDRLAAEGLRFDRAYCQQAVCAPSRASLLTGLRPDSTHIYDLKHPVRKVLPDVVSLPQHFRSNGYETLSLGKIYHHHDDDNGKGWSQPAWHARAGAWKGRGYLTPEAQEQIDSGQRKGAGVGPAFEAAEASDDDYPDGQTALEALTQLRRLAKEKRPFFLAVGFIKPHLPFNAPKRYWDLYDEAAIRLPEQQQWPQGMPKVAGTGWGELRQYVGIPRQGHVDAKLSRTLIHGYYAATSYTDTLVGRLLDEVKSLGLRKRTILILWGDHGWKLGDYGAWCKHTNFEVDAHAPLILSVPGQQSAGRSTKALVEFVDIFPTLAELCGLPVPPHCEGTSMVPLLENPDRDWKPAAFSQYPRAGGIMGYSMRTVRWRYTEWINRKTGEVTARELYDHTASEIAPENLAGRPEYASVVQRLSHMLAAGQGWKQFTKTPGGPQSD